VPTYDVDDATRRLRAATFEAKRAGMVVRACAAQVQYLAGEVLPLDITATGAGRAYAGAP